jgi:hypothetical protein
MELEKPTCNEKRPPGDASCRELPPVHHCGGVRDAELPGGVTGADPKSPPAGDPRTVVGVSM